MGLFSWIFGAKTTAAQDTNSQPEVRDRSIKFHPELVQKLEDDHQAVFALYGEMLEFVNKQEFSKLGAKINEFKMALQGHVIVENVQFYTYLENKLRDDATNLSFIKDVRKEMNNIARVVVQFSKKYEKAHFDGQTQQDFIVDLEKIGKILTQRISMEESQLYPLYEV